MKSRLKKLPSFTEFLQGHSIHESFSRHRGHKIKINPASDGSYGYEISALIEGQPPLHSTHGFASEEAATKSAKAFIEDYQQNFISSNHSIVSQEEKFNQSPVSTSGF